MPPFTKQAAKEFHDPLQMDEIESRLQTAQAHLRGAMEWIAKAMEENQRRLDLKDIAKRDYPQPNDWAVIVPVESAYLASFGPNETVGEKFDRILGAPVKEHRRVADADELRAAGIGTVEPRHPMQAEADRIIGTELHPLAGPESRL
jgi:hypothetical protein